MIAVGGHAPARRTTGSRRARRSSNGPVGIAMSSRRSSDTSCPSASASISAALSRISALPSAAPADTPSTFIGRQSHASCRADYIPAMAATRRVDSELLLVGSLPADSTDEALRRGAEYFGDLVFALPDGETGPRQAWVGYERERLCRPNPDVVVVEETASPTGIPRHAYETPDLRDPRRRRPALGLVATDRRRDRVLPGVPRSAGAGPDPVRSALPDRAAVPVERAERVQGRLRPRLPDRRARVRGSRGARAHAPAERDPGRPTSRSSGTARTRPRTSRACWRGRLAMRGSGSPAPPRA